MEETKKSRPIRRVWKRWIQPLLVIVIVMSSFRSVIADWNDVPSGSMRPTILVGDRIFVNKLAYDLRIPFSPWSVSRWQDPARGEIVVLISPHDGKRLVKRVVGSPGDRLAIRNRRVWLNGAPVSYGPVLSPLQQVVESDSSSPDGAFLEEDLGPDGHLVRWDLRPQATQLSEIVIPEGHYFVMGDNRDRSFDSRFFGLVDRDRILGRAEAVVTSLDWNRGFRPRWHRWLQPLR